MVAPTLTKESIQIPGAPDIPGLKFRHYLGESDLPGMVKLNKLVSLADQTEEIGTLEQLSHHFAHLKNCDPQKDVVLGEVDGELIIYTRVHWVQDDAHHVVAVGVDIERPSHGMNAVIPDGLSLAV